MFGGVRAPSQRLKRIRPRGDGGRQFSHCLRLNKYINLKKKKKEKVNRKLSMFSLECKPCFRLYKSIEFDKSSQRLARAAHVRRYPQEVLILFRNFAY